jgi:hypothetical protein
MGSRRGRGVRLAPFGEGGEATQVAEYDGCVPAHAAEAQAVVPSTVRLVDYVADDLTQARSVRRHRGRVRARRRREFPATRAWSRRKAQPRARECPLAGGDGKGGEAGCMAPNPADQSALSAVAGMRHKAVPCGHDDAAVVREVIEDHRALRDSHERSCAGVLSQPYGPTLGCRAV